VIDDDQLVGKIENEVALLGAPGQPLPDRLELEREIVAERAVQAQVWLVAMVEERDDGAEHGEDRRLSAAFFLGEPPGRLAHDARHDVVGADDALDVDQPPEGLGDARQQHAAARVERLHAEAARASDERERGIDEAHVPARVAAGVFVAGGEQDAPALVERGDERIDRAGDGEHLHRALHADASPGLVAGRRHWSVSSGRGADPGGGNTKTAPRGGFPGLFGSTLVRACGTGPPSGGRPPPPLRPRTARDHGRHPRRARHHCQAPGALGVHSSAWPSIIRGVSRRRPGPRSTSRPA
jgi:hypothetical protein